MTRRWTLDYGRARCTRFASTSGQVRRPSAHRRRGAVRRIFHFSSGADPHYLQLYEEKYHRLNPAFPTMLFFDEEEPRSVVPDCITREEFCRSRFGREWLFPQGMVDGLFAHLEKSSTACSTLIVAQTLANGFADEKMRQRFSLVVPHIRRAALIGKAIDLKTVEAAALADSLDMLSSAMFIVEASGRIVHANASGHADDQRGSALRARMANCRPSTCRPTASYSTASPLPRAATLSSASMASRCL